MEKPTVLVVDAEALIRISAAHMVEDADYGSVQAANAEDAIRLLEDRRDIRAVFTDINMSGSMDGLRLAHAIRGRWPPIHLIVTSGLDVSNKLPAKGRFLRKPYTSEQLVAVLHELFGHDPSPIRLLHGQGTSHARVAQR